MNRRFLKLRNRWVVARRYLNLRDRWVVASLSVILGLVFFALAWPFASESALHRKFERESPERLPLDTVEFIELVNNYAHGNPETMSNEQLERAWDNTRGWKDDPLIQPWFAKADAEHRKRQLILSGGGRADLVAYLARKFCTPPSIERVTQVALNHQDWSEDELAQVVCDQVQPGMLRPMVLAVKGPPARKQTYAPSGVIHEHWFYSDLDVHFTDGVVTAVQARN